MVQSDRSRFSLLLRASYLDGTSTSMADTPRKRFALSSGLLLLVGVGSVLFLLAFEDLSLVDSIYFTVRAI